MMNEVYAYCEEFMDKSLKHLDHEYKSLRTGRATPTLLDNIRVDYYGMQTPLNQCSTISVPEARLLVVQPWDKSILSAIEKAIQAANLGLNPQNDGQLIRIPIPAMNDERRQELVRIVHQMAEEARVAIRNIRRDANDKIKKLEKDKDISEDDAKSAYAEIQKITDKNIEKVNDAQQSKEKDILSE
ncbi:MAG: ribosome recycling factor [Candidatus Neomarinimicrobiota bacterium]|jgi:ribosome recycling factor|nr:ribosome recycling factor [Candidatus Neomarinimicrobiota bacterium]MDD3965983.1 ribosome recycling factor [Candidatus Neomarinimicrobiota bacterium]MDD4960977.1 ribosome recycling factor [Candidatus Neomarinimicrobiota bacterium]MDD5710105.1 ribosome recycling factor [Candidatus Neomarinimicrobiota bacterium]MDX9781184.1 ribosome recycling factor [bacterium]